MKKNCDLKCRTSASINVYHPKVIRGLLPILQCPYKLRVDVPTTLEVR
jgi:hypothetical protein